MALFCQTYLAILRHYFGLWVLFLGVFHYFYIFYTLKDK